MVLPRDSTCPEKLARSSPDLKCPKKEAPGDKVGEDSEAELEEARDITATLLVPPLMVTVRPCIRVFLWSLVTIKPLTG